MEGEEVGCYLGFLREFKFERIVYVSEEKKGKGGLERVEGEEREKGSSTPDKVGSFAAG